MRRLLLFAAAVQSAWMLADGTHALLTGRYFGPRLGPWAAVVSQAGIDPRSTAMKYAFLAFGIVWLAILTLVAARIRQGLLLAIVAGILTLWYLPIGTLLSAITIVCALLLRRAPTVRT
jgi:hypothetical protein